MKKLIEALSVIMFLIIAGCQDSPVDPVQNDRMNQPETEKTSEYRHGVIQLQGLLVDPQHLGNSYYLITGEIKYNYRILFTDPIIPSVEKYLKIHFETNADFQYFCTLCTPPAEDVLAGFISNQSDENVLLVGNSVTELEKSFPLQGTENGMTLNVRFLISYNRIELNAMWLALPKVNSEATVNYY